MKIKYVIGTNEFRAIDDYIKWQFSNPSPCDSCSDKLTCSAACKEHGIHEDRKNWQLAQLPSLYRETYVFLEKLGYVELEIKRLKMEREYDVLGQEINDILKKIKNILIVNDVEIK